MMMAGKRSAGRPGPARHPMRRTTSMTEFAPAADVLLADVAELEEEEEDSEAELQLLPAHAEGQAAGDGGGSKQEDAPYYGWAAAAAAASRAEWLEACRRARAAPPARRSSADLSAAETAAFLRACGLCNRRLGPGRDTFMYRGDTAFCSLECRQQHMTIEEWKEKCALAAAPPPAAAPAPAAADPVPVAPPTNKQSGAAASLAAA